MFTLALVLSVSGIIYALLIGLLVFVVAYVIILVCNRAGLALPIWIAAAFGAITFLLALLGGVTS